MNFTRINEKCISTLPRVGLFLDVAISKRIKTDEAKISSHFMFYLKVFFWQSRNSAS